MTRRHRTPWRALALLPSLVLLAALANAQTDAADTAFLVKALGLRDGSVVADVGAGRAALTIPLARAVAPSGRVYATELGGPPLSRLRDTVTAAAVEDVVVLEGDPVRTNLPAGCCDAVVIRNVYHHFADPPAMNASLLASLKRDGLLAVLDFAPDGAEAPLPAGRSKGKTHGVRSATVVKELGAAGFDLVSVTRRADATFAVVARKPSRP